MDNENLTFSERSENKQPTVVNYDGHDPKKKTQSKFRLSVLRGIVSGILLVVFFFAGYFLCYYSFDKDLRSLYFVYKTYKNNYYYENDDDIPAKILTEGLMDIYSEYYTAEEYKKELAAGKGSRAGFGVSFIGFKIYKVSGNSPAEKAGLMSGGTVIEYKINDGSTIQAEDSELFLKTLSGTNEDDLLSLKIDYDGDVKEFSFKKSRYRESYVYYADNTGKYRFNDTNGKMTLSKYSEDTSDCVLGDDWGYIKYTSFYGETDDVYGSVGQFLTVLDKMSENGKSKLIIDLRNNGGGFMSILCSLSGIFCKNIPSQKGTRVAQIAEYKNKNTSNFNIDEKYGKKADGTRYSDLIKKIIFLANENSASASEAFIGTMLDYDSASGSNSVRVVLDPSIDKNGNTVYKTYGKGIMQSTFTNGITGEALKLTTARIYWPLSKTCIHGIGITKETDERVYESVGDTIAYAQTL